MTNKIKKLFIKMFLLLGLFGSFWFFGFTSFAGWEGNPGEILDGLRDKDVQKTHLDKVQWEWVKWVLEWVKYKSNDYIQWLWFIWLSVGLILIIRLWIYILWNFWEENRISKAKKRFVSLTLWLIVLTSWYMIIKAILAIVSNVTW